MKRLHSTNSKTIILSNRHYPQEADRRMYKPTGLWYSLDNEWFEWCQSESFGGIHKYTFSLDIDTSKVCIIETKQQLISFFNRYKREPWKGATHYSIDWLLVSMDYSGCEIRNYHELKWSDAIPMLSNTWLWGWDVSSGCIWDLTALKSFTKHKTSKKWLSDPISK